MFKPTLSVLLLSLTACQGSGTLIVLDPSGSGTSATTAPTTVTGPPEGSCGDISVHDLTIAVSVQRGEAAASGVDVWLEDRGWEPGTIMATGVTNDDGVVILDVTDLTSVEDCWGTLLDYVVATESGDLYDEREVNTSLFNAILNGTFEADLRDFPLQLQ